MSFCRFGWDGSDVYVIINDSLECCGCVLAGDDGNWSYPNTDAMLAHLDEHIAAGNTVPDYAVQRLKDEREENDHYIATGEWTRG